MPVRRRSASSIAMSRIGRGPLDGSTLRRVLATLRRVPLDGRDRSSTRATSSPLARLQSGQVPGFGLAKPHCWHR